jgi:SOS-response transcriptional repressor LexA
MNMHIGNVVRLKRKQAGLTLADIADQIEGYDAGNLSRFERGEQNISEERLRVIAKILNTTLPGLYFELEQLIEGHPVEGADLTDQNIKPGPNIQGLVPLISWVKAGQWHEAQDLYTPGEAEEYLPCPASHGDLTFALRVNGDSMTAPYGKSYPHGCIIFVDPDQRGGIVSGDRVIAKLNGDNAVTFKVFIDDAGTKFLKPLNPQHPSITSEFRILGKVIGKWEPE